MQKWKKYNRAIIPDFPPHLEVEDSLKDINSRLQDSGMFFARWTSEFDCQRETEFWHVINDQKLELNDYSRNTRSKIRRGLKRCKIVFVNKDEIKKYGFESYSKAFLRYRTHILPKDINNFRKEIDMLDDGWHFWAIYNNTGKMIGYSQNRIFDDYCDYSTIKFHPDYLHLYPSFALFYTMNRYYLNDNKFKYVNDGARSISHETNIQDFLIQKFKFRKAYCKLHLLYSPNIRRIISVLYPFRNILSFIRFSLFDKINIILKQEKIWRSFSNDIIYDIQPVIIVGAARSGTHLIASSIQKNLPCIYLNEINDLWKKQFPFLRSDEIQEDQLTSEKVIKTRNEFNKLIKKENVKGYLLEKTASNCLRLELVSRVFPNARFIHIRRDGKAVAVSVRKKYFGDIRKLSSVDSVDNTTRERISTFFMELKHKFQNRLTILMFFSNIFRYLRMSLVILGIKKKDFWGPRFLGYRKLMKNVSPLELAVIQWKYCCKKLNTFFKDMDSDQYLLISYEDIISDPSLELRKVLRFILQHDYDGPIHHNIRSKGLLRWDDDLDNEEIKFLDREINESLL